MDDPTVYVLHLDSMQMNTSKNYVHDRMQAALIYISEYAETKSGHSYLLPSCQKEPSRCVIMLVGVVPHWTKGTGPRFFTRPACLRSYSGTTPTHNHWLHMYIY